MTTPECAAGEPVGLSPKELPDRWQHRPEGGAAGEPVVFP